MIKINFSYKYLLFFLTLIALISFSEIGNSAPDETAPGRNPACTSPISLVNDCETQPATQIITFHKVALCTALPTEPTTTSATGLASCVTVFENTAGAAVSVVKGEGVSPSGTFTDPPYGNYTFAYVELSNVFTYKADLVFNDTTFSSDGSGSNTNCRTNGISFTQFRADDTLNGIVCGDTEEPTVATNTNVILNSLSTSEGVFSTRFPGTNGNTDVYLIQSDGKKATASTPGNTGNVSKVIAFLPITANITPDTTSYNLQYNNTQGMNVYQFETIGFNQAGFNIAYFDLTITVQ